VVLSAEFAGQELTWQGRIVRTEAQIDTMQPHGSRGRPRRQRHSRRRSVGLFVNAEIEGCWPKTSCVLPRSALREGNRVLIVDAEDRLRYREVEPLRLHQDQVLVRAGLAPASGCASRRCRPPSTACR
jgi:hypothetical protein